MYRSVEQQSPTTMNLAAESEREIRNAYASIESFWMTNSDQWEDQAKRYFETEYMQPILMETSDLVKQIQELSITIDAARREVE